MKIYIAGRYSQKEYLKGFRTQLEQRGHEVTSSWLDIDDSQVERTENFKTQCALQDCYDIDRSDLLIAVFQDSVTGYQGTYFEIGLAMSMIRVIWIGGTTCIFRNLPSIAKYDTIPHFLQSVDPHTLVR